MLYGNRLGWSVILHFYGARTFVNVLTGAAIVSALIVLKLGPNRFFDKHSDSRSTSPYSPMSLNYLLTCDFSKEMLPTFLVYPMSVTYLARLILFDLVTTNNTLLSNFLNPSINHLVISSKSSVLAPLEWSSFTPVADNRLIYRESDVLRQNIPWVWLRASM